MTISYIKSKIKSVHNELKIDLWNLQIPENIKRISYKIGPNSHYDRERFLVASINRFFRN